MASALILGNYRPSFAIARTLKEKGYRVICNMDGFDRGAEVSRHVDAIWQHPPFARNKDEFQTALNQFLNERTDVEIVVPVTEDLIRAFANQDLTLSNRVRLVSMKAPLVLTCLDKPKMLGLIDKLNIPTPAHSVAVNRNDLTTVIKNIDLPIIIRALDSTKLINGKKAVIVKTEQDLETLEIDFKSHPDGLLVQHYVDGKRDNIYFAAKDGKLHRYLHAKIERTDEKDGSGLAVEGVTVSPCPTLRRYTETLLKELNYSGIGCLQFLVDETTKDISFIELNPRIAGNHALPEYCGLNLGEWLLDETLNRQNASDLRMGREGVRYTWLAGEIQALKKSKLNKSISAFDFFTKTIHAIGRALRADLDIGISKKDLAPGIVTLCDALPLVGHLTRKRFENGIISRLMILKEKY